MTSDLPSGREKVASKLPEWLRLRLKAHAARQHIDVQDAVAEAIALWRSTPDPPPLDTSGARSFGTWLPPGMWKGFEAECTQRGISYIQGLTQAVYLWLKRPHEQESAVFPQRIICANQKGGVGKTSVASGLAQALAESTEHGGLGLRVLIVDYDPQGDLTVWHGLDRIPLLDDNSQHSLVKHLLGNAKNDDIRDLLITLEGERFGGRLQLLPNCMDAFLLEASMGQVRAKEVALEKALAQLEADVDVVIIDCPPSLGLSMDAAVYYGRRREGEPEGRSGILIPVQAEDSSAEAYKLFTWQIEGLCTDLDIDVDYLGFVVNLFDKRRGTIAQTSLEEWQAFDEPRVLAVVKDLKEQREQVRLKEPLFTLSPDSEHANSMRLLAKELRANA